MVQVGDRFYDLHRKDQHMGVVPMGVVVSIINENLIGVIYDIGTEFKIFPKEIFGNRLVFVNNTRTPSVSSVLLFFKYWVHALLFLTGLLVRSFILKWSFTVSPNTDWYAAPSSIEGDA